MRQHYDPNNDYWWASVEYKILWEQVCFLEKGAPFTADELLDIHNDMCGAWKRYNKTT